MEKEIKTGTVGIVGPTNSGKSTLLNALIGEKISIVSPKVQTTYHSIKGISTTDEAQVVFTDTPGFQSFPSVIPRLLNKVADRSARECDLLVWVFDVSSPRVMTHITKMAPKIREMRPQAKSFCVLNKADKVKKPDLLPILLEVSKLELFSQVIPVSALRNDGLDSLMKVLKSEMTVGVPQYEADQMTDRPMTFLAAEMVREQIYQATYQEVPYGSYVEIEKWENPAEGQRMPTIYAVIHVDSDSQKGIIIGKSGEMLKRIGMKAREGIERLTGSQVVLKLHVDVETGWNEDKRQVQTYLELNS